MPFLRIPIPENPDPEPVTYAALRTVLDQFAADLAEAEATLAAVPDSAFELPLRVPMVRLDFDGDGSGAPAESVGTLFLAVTGVDLASPEWTSWGDELTAGRVAPFGLDESDVPWLQGYCHLLSALADFLLAHDWEDAFDATFHSAFPATPSSGLAAEDRRLLDSLGPEPPHLTYDQDGYDEWAASPEAQAYREWESKRGWSSMAGIADLVAFVRTTRSPDGRCSSTNSRRSSKASASCLTGGSPRDAGSTCAACSMSRATSIPG
jgi:hypothetical protein